jgi:hypothetical protein
MFYYATKDSIGALCLEQFRDEIICEALALACAVVGCFLYELYMLLTLGTW